MQFHSSYYFYYFFHGHTYIQHSMFLGKRVIQTNQRERERERDRNSFSIMTSDVLKPPPNYH